MNSIQVLASLFIGFGWVIFFYWSFGKLKGFIDSELEEEKKVKLSARIITTDLFFFFLGAYGFYTKFFQDIIKEISVDRSQSETVLISILIGVIYFGGLGLMSYIAPPFHKYFRYAITLLVFYIFITFSIVIFLSSKNISSDFSGFARTIFGIYNWFLLVLFPFEIGSSVRKAMIFSRIKRPSD